MTSALVNNALGPGAPALADDLQSVGIQVVGDAQHDTLVQDAIRTAPDLVICYASHPDDALFASTSALGTAAPRPVVLFTNDPDADKIERATRSGIHAYVINGYGLHRLRSVIHVAQARFRHDQLLRDELSEISNRFDERKLVDRAKGILMRARQISEDDAFRALRTAAMHSKQRVGQVSRQVIDSARFAEAVNRAGQLRMLSQRLVKLYALLCVPSVPAETAGLFADSFERTDNNLAILARSLSKPTFGDLLDAVLEPWAQLKAALAAPPAAARLPEVDRLAERLLAQAEQLTGNLESAGYATTLHILNVAGRQRMLSQRLAKQALIAALLPGTPAVAARAAARQTEASLVEALAYLNGIPLSTREIRDELRGAEEAWQAMRDALPDGHGATGQAALAHTSELLLAHFDRLTDHYERSMQMLMG